MFRASFLSVQIYGYVGMVWNRIKVMEDQWKRKWKLGYIRGSCRDMRDLNKIITLGKPSLVTVYPCCASSELKS